jgi:hypothetical protein
MGDWTTQNWTKRDGRNSKQEQQEKSSVKDCSRTGSQKVMCKTAAELKI